jgi:hypothetical protein
MEEEMYFFIADISGYTAYMLKNVTDFTHGTLIVTELMEALIQEASLPIEIAKLEGDALFLYLQQSKVPREYRDNPQLFGDKILQFFHAFFSKLRQLESSTTCTCGGCANIHNLNVKMVAHYGKAAIHHIGKFQELSGVDVIVAHRLLKNKVKEKCYLLMTESAHQRLTLPSEGTTIPATEEDKDLGTFSVYVYYPSFAKSHSPHLKSSFAASSAHHLKLIWGGLLLKLGLKKTPQFTHFPPR